MDDLISRKEALKAVGVNSWAGFRINSLPSAQRTGRWIRKSNWMWTCSCCGSDNVYAYKSDDAYEPTVLQDFFCPHCGAKMEVEE